jgi:hypothetical protein
MERLKEALAVLRLGGVIGFVAPLIIVVISAIGIFWAAFTAMIFAVPVYFIWNWLMPELFGIISLTFWQAWGITFLASLLVKGAAPGVYPNLKAPNQSRS